MMTAGLLLFTRIEPSGSAIVYVILPGLLTAAGIALSIVPSTIAATQGRARDRRGSPPASSTPRARSAAASGSRC